MKKLIALISGVSLAALAGGLSLAAEQDKEHPGATRLAQAEDLNSSRSNVSSEIEKEDDQTPEGEEVQAEDFNSSRSNLSSVTEGEDQDQARMKGDFSRDTTGKRNADEGKKDQREGAKPEEDEKDDDGDGLR